MIESITVINYVGDHIELPIANPYSTGMAITKIEGIGPGKANVITTDNITMDWTVFNSSRLSYRNIVLTLKLLGTDSNGQSIEATRHQVYKYFPIKKPLWLIFESENRSAKIQGYVESNEPEIFSDFETTQISIICPFPYFSDLEDQTTVMLKGNSGTRYTVDYNGEAETGMTLTFETLGTITGDVVVTDETTSQTLTVNASKISQKYGNIVMGDKIIIDTVKGEKKALLEKRNGTYNIINCIDRRPVWFELKGGYNVFYYTADSATATDLQITITNKVLYEGL